MVVYVETKISEWNVDGLGDFKRIFNINITKLKHYDKNKHKDIYDYVQYNYTCDYDFMEEYLEQDFEVYTIDWIESNYGYWNIKQIKEPIPEEEYEFALKQLGKTRLQIKEEMELINSI